MTVSDDLNAAADVLERDGWIQGDFHTDQGFCAVGALVQAVTVEFKIDNDVSRAVAAQRALQEYLGVEQVPTWNDDPTRKAEEVIQAMRDAAMKNQPDSMWG